ncbi:hypothetical protein BC936DRAFT_141211, partial [Jimgerdemannia flammicorona]
MMGNIVGRYKRNNKELPEFPKNIADFGYAFNEQGELRNIETNGRFEFNVVDDDRKFNQAHYEALGDAIGIWIESELETRFGLVKRVIPEEGDRHDTDDHRGESGPTATSRIYMRYAECASWLDGTFYVRVYSIIPSFPNPPPLPLLSQYPIPLPPFSKAPMPSQTPPRSCFSSKVPVPFVRASGRVLSSSTTRSSMFPYIHRAKEQGWSVIVFNPNENEGELPTTHESAGPFDYDTMMEGSRKRVKRVARGALHVRLGKVRQVRVNRRSIYCGRGVFSETVVVSDEAWRKCTVNDSDSSPRANKFISEMPPNTSKAQAKHILIVAHSYGGYSTATLATSIPNFTERVRAIALTDSVHSAGSVYDTQGMIKQWFSDNAINWIKSNKPLGAHEPSAERYFGCPCVSAGHPKHEYTSGTAFASVFNFLEIRLVKAMEQAEEDVGAGTMEGERALEGKGSSFGKVERNDKKGKEFMETKGKAFVETEGKEFVETEGKEFVETEGKEFVETEGKAFVET